jgi:thiamine biosynthesis lipoprotein
VNKRTFFTIIFGVGIVCAIILSVSRYLNESFPTYFVEELSSRPLAGTDLQEFTQTSHQMSTVVTLKAHAKERAPVARAFKEAFDAIERLSLIFNRHDPRSELYKLNQSAGKGPVRTSRELGEVIHRSLEVCRETEGALDITILPLLQLFARKEKEGKKPSDDELETALARVSYKKVSVSEDFTKVTLRDGAGIDLGATAKGYIVDEIAKIFQKHGIEGALIEAGGDLYALGRRGDGQLWHVAIRDPLKPQEFLQTVCVENAAVTTSGNYARGYEIEGRRVSHIFDPRTGKSAENVLSVTVIASDTFTADAFSTALSVLGSSGLELVENTEGLAAYMVCSDDKTSQKARIILSSGFKKYLAE